MRRFGSAARAYATPTTRGAEDDLQQATSLARRMVLDWGMSERLGPMASGRKEEQVFLGEEIAQRRDYSEETALIVDEEVRSIIGRAFERASDVLEEKRDALARIAEVLRDEEEITGDRVREILEEWRSPTRQPHRRGAGRRGRPR